MYLLLVGTHFVGQACLKIVAGLVSQPPVLANVTIVLVHMPICLLMTEGSLLLLPHLDVFAFLVFACGGRGSCEWSDTQNGEQE